MKHNEIETLELTLDENEPVSTFRELVKQLSQWLKRRASDATLPAIEQAAYINVLNKIEQLKGKQ